jgi:hypothetical protein
MVGDRENSNAAAPGNIDQLGGRSRAVRFICVRMKVNQHAEQYKVILRAGEQGNR